MSDLHNNEVLAKLRDKLAAPTPPKKIEVSIDKEPTEGDQQKARTPDEITIAINSKRVILFLPIGFAHVVADSTHRPAIQFSGDRLFLVREPKNAKNARRIGTKIENSKAAQFQIENHMCPGLAEWFDGLECGKSRVAIEWLTKDVWHIHLVRDNLCDLRKIARRSKLRPVGLDIIGVIPKGESVEEAVSEPRSAESTPTAPACAPAQPEPTEQPDRTPSGVGRLRILLAEANRTKQIMGPDLMFSLDEGGMIHATLRLI